MKAHPPHVMRMINELSEMTDRLQGLAKFMATPTCKALPPAEAKLLSHQAVGMMLYATALGQRLRLAAVVT